MFFAIEQGGADDIRQIGGGDDGDPGSEEREGEGGQALHVDFEGPAVEGEAGEEGLDGLPELIELAHFAEEQGDIQRTEGKEEGSGEEDGGAAFQHLGAENFIAAVGRHEEHIALAGVHIPMEGDDAFKAHDQRAAEGKEGERQDGDSRGVFLLRIEPIKEGDFRYGGDGQENDLGEPGFTQFIFHEFQHVDYPSVCP